MLLPTNAAEKPHEIRKDALVLRGLLSYLHLRPALVTRLCLSCRYICFLLLFAQRSHFDHPGMPHNLHQADPLLWVRVQHAAYQVLRLGITHPLENGLFKIDDLLHLLARRSAYYRSLLEQIVK